MHRRLTAEQPDSTSRLREFLARASLLATAFVVFEAGLRIYQGSGIWPPATVLSLLLYVVAVGCLILAFVLRRPDSPRAIGVIGCVLLAAVSLSVIHEIDFANPSYGTDAIAFAHASGEILIEGDNPYEVEGVVLDEVIDAYGLPGSFVTRTNTGQAVDRLVSYPAGHPLAYAAGVAVGLQDLRWVTVVFQLAALVVLWFGVSATARLISPFVLLMDDNLGVFFTSGGVTDWLWVLPLLVTAFALSRHRFGYAGLALGVACAMKQQPWFLVPFVIVWAYQELRTSNKVVRREAMGGLLSGFGAGFLFLNLPFMVWSFGDWWRGILHPVLGNLVPDGQGFSVLSTKGLLPIPAQAYTVALVLLAGALLWAYARWFDRLQDLLWVIPPLLLLVSPRSFHSYFIYWVPLALVWLDLRINQTRDTEAEPDVRRYARTMVLATKTSLSFLGAMLVVAAGIGVAGAMNSRHVEVVDVRAKLMDGVVTSLDVALVNNTRDVLTPVFEVYWQGQPVPWRPISSSRIPPGEEGFVEIVPAKADSIPPLALEPTGSRRVTAFRVRVNQSGESRFYSSDIVSVPVSSGLVNTQFSQWTREGTSFSAPYGWYPTWHGGTDSLRVAESDSDGTGAALNVVSLGAGPDDWIETTLNQNVPSLNSCYRWSFVHTVDYTTDRNGSPLAASGVQVIQGGSSVWFVPSDVEGERVTTLMDGTRVVEVSATKDEPAVVVLQVPSFAAASGLDPDAPGLIKLFNAVHQTIAAESRIATSELAPVKCV